MKRLLLLLSLTSFLVLAAAPASAINRDEMIAIADAYAKHTWVSTWSNYTASCSGAYTSKFLDIYGVGGHTGMAYDWGGFDTISGFDGKSAGGHGAGSHPDDGVLSCTTGVDCSGYVSRCWALTSKKGTSTIHTVSHEIAPTQVLKGDAYNKASSHIRLWHYQAGDGQPVIYESAGGSKRKVWYNTGITWSSFAGYTPIRYDGVNEGTGPAAGALNNPIVVDTFPYHHDYTTLTSGPSNFNVYNCAPSTGEYGPEVIYKLLLPGKGHLTASVTDGAGVDIDLHVLTQKDPNTCLDRDDKVVGPVALESEVAWLVADSWSNSSGTTYPGSYSLDITFQVTAPFVDPEPEPEPEPEPDPGPQCGDGSCNGDEACGTCAMDCGECPTSCLDRCGELAQPGQLCYCDTSCVNAGDCCPDYQALCVGSTSCVDRCGELAQPGDACYCDEHCPQAGDCCPDYDELCLDEGDNPQLVEPEEPASTLPVLSTSPIARWIDETPPTPEEAVAAPGGGWEPGSMQDPKGFSTEESGCQAGRSHPGIPAFGWLLLLLGCLGMTTRRRATS